MLKSLGRALRCEFDPNIRGGACIVWFEDNKRLIFRRCSQAWANRLAVSLSNRQGERVPFFVLTDISQFLPLNRGKSASRAGRWAARGEVKANDYPNGWRW